MTGQVMLPEQYYCLRDELTTDRNLFIQLPSGQLLEDRSLLPTAKLHGDRRSIGLQPLIRAYGEGLRYEELASRIEALRPAILEGARRAEGTRHPC
jgi:hypothetical protein